MSSLRVRRNRVAPVRIALSLTKRLGTGFHYIAVQDHLVLQRHHPHESSLRLDSMPCHVASARHRIPPLADPVQHDVSAPTHRSPRSLNQGLRRIPTAHGDGHPPNATSSGLRKSALVRDNLAGRIRDSTAPHRVFPPDSGTLSRRPPAGQQPTPPSTPAGVRNDHPALLKTVGKALCAVGLTYRLARYQLWDTSLSEHSAQSRLSVPSPIPTLPSRRRAPRPPSPSRPRATDRRVTPWDRRGPMTPAPSTVRLSVRQSATSRLPASA